MLLASVTETTPALATAAVDSRPGAKRTTDLGEICESLLRCLATAIPTGIPVRFFVAAPVLPPELFLFA